MPTREEVSQELLDYAKSILKELYNDYRKLPCRGTITSLISCLYETAIISFTLKNGNGVANYKYIKLELVGDYTNALVRLQDDLIHNFNRSVDYKHRILLFLEQFGVKNFELVWNQCIAAPSIYDSLFQFCSNEHEEFESPKTVAVF